ncbi:hypothetical protein [Actinoplanes sp. NPDC048796]|uniref:hypothetical protein n=1 Tax=Actinoplanes sp. NPDC048796 TaxID=3155640 RepID=UPI0033C5EA35
MHRTARRHALAALSGITTIRAPRGGWRRDDPGDGGGDGSSGHSNAGGGNTDDKDGDDDAGKASGDKTPKIEGDLDPERHARALAAAREGERKAKDARKASDDRLASVLKALGLNADGKADPEEQVKALTTERDDWRNKATGAITRNAIRDAAETHKAKAAELLDSQSFLNQLKDLDATADDFDDKVADLVKAAVKANPAKYGATEPGAKGTGKQGADHSGAGGNNKTKPKGLAAAVTAALSGN